MAVSLNEFVPLDGIGRWAYLQRARKVRLATSDDAGAIHVSAEWFVTDEETLYIPLDGAIGDPGATTTPANIHISNISRNKVVSGVVDEGDEITEFRSVHFRGTAHIIEGEIVETLLDLSAAKYFYHTHPHLEFYFSDGAVKNRRWYRIDIDEMSGWDARLLAQPPINERRLLPK
ncbi:pyridoxamine 5'-phosphate oxidase family protein (plasmid) [Rhodococcus sp. ZPP]|uniref:pyridoxamine 5'-phosphate oxidase family protein n=1 Tax=unclassified Rhodococcus (in: high G+C Gram-positive bacteria) TaxID=192944 RepID=UPI00135C0DB6|nr:MULTISPECIES: pyridoxamine 5'-phosphate oxidase family protein [unclassified Rhodococcus (in: high G+C Gram-positive bacteria)]QTJ70154.1 pyridoxamine 5'-phosphate oxidase family protein [Rhodococcus sp. ZPP]